MRENKSGEVSKTTGSRRSFTIFMRAALSRQVTVWAELVSRLFATNSFQPLRFLSANRDCVQREHLLRMAAEWGVN
jgi:hypothetical protein